MAQAVRRGSFGGEGGARFCGWSFPGGARIEIGGGRQVALAAALLRALAGEGAPC